MFFFRERPTLPAFSGFMAPLPRREGDSPRVRATLRGSKVVPRQPRRGVVVRRVLRARSAAEECESKGLQGPKKHFSGRAFYKMQSQKPMFSRRATKRRFLPKTSSSKPGNLLSLKPKRKGLSLSLPTPPSPQRAPTVGASGLRTSPAPTSCS